MPVISLPPIEISGLLEKYDPLGKRMQYFESLMDENKRINLVSRETSPTDLDRLFADSLIPFESVTVSPGRYLDIGSGGGFPAIPILLCGLAGSKTTLMERTQKKAGALKRILESLSLSATVISKTFEEVELEGQFDLITLRYVKLTGALLTGVVLSLSVGGSFIYYSRPEFSQSDFPMSTYQYFTSVDTTCHWFSHFRKN
jgi:16S rRNA (guanine(527)-N(7))-methyltransferase RsmG